MKKLWLAVTGWARMSVWIAMIGAASVAYLVGVYASTGQVSLSGLDLFFFTTTVLSLCLNVLQFQKDNQTYLPLRASLIALFNDLRNRQLRSAQRRQLLARQDPNATGPAALHVEFFDFITESEASYEQVKEHVVGAIHTLDPDISSVQVFKAVNFGMTPEQIASRDEGFHKLWEQKPDSEKGVSASEQYPVNSTKSGGS